MHVWNQVRTAVLQTLSDDEWFSPKVVQARISRSNRYIRAVLVELEEQGLVEGSYKKATNGKVGEVWRRTEQGAQSRQKRSGPPRCPACRRRL